MQVINSQKAGELTNQLVADRSIGRWDAAQYVFKNYIIKSSKFPRKNISTPQAVLAAAERQAGIRGSCLNKTKTENGTTIRRTKNMEEYNLRKNIREILSISVSDYTKIKFIKEIVG